MWGAALNQKCSVIKNPPIWEGIEIQHPGTTNLVIIFAWHMSGAYWPVISGAPGSVRYAPE